MILIVAGGEVYTPEPAGPASVLALNGSIALIGSVDRHVVSSIGVGVDVLDAHDCIVAPGLIDPHAHLLGGSGESGFGSSTPEIFVSELVDAGVTTVVGCLGVDTTTKTMATLVAKAKALRVEGLTAYAWSGGYDVPPATLLGSVREDMLFVDEIIGAGEIAIADARATPPAVSELARVVADSHVGGLLTGKAGVTHFHVGDGRARLHALRELLSTCDVRPESLYPSHVERTPELIGEAAELSRDGVFVDVDTVAGDLARSLAAFEDAGGAMDHLTVSSDASATSPRQRLDQLRDCARTARLPLDRLLSLVTANTAGVLKLGHKGRLRPGADADLLVLTRDTLELRHVVARGRVLMRDGVIVARERFLQSSARRLRLDADET